MSLIQNAETGMWEADLKDRMAGRLHISLRTKVKREAMPRYAALVAFVREGDVDLIAKLRDRKIHIAAIERCVRDRVPFASLRANAARWPTVTDAIDQYVTWLEANENKADATADTAASQLARFAAYETNGEALGAWRLDDITTEHVTAYQQFLATVGNNGVPYAVNTRTAYIGRVAALYAFHREEEERHAIEDRRAPRSLHSPVDARTQPKGRTVRERWLTREEADALLAATPDQLRFPVAAGLLAGFRVNEMLHLRATNADVDLTAGTLRIQEKEWRIGNTPVTWEPKTKRSARRVPVNDDLRVILAHHLRHYASNDWVTPSSLDGTQPMSASTFHPLFRRVVRDAELVADRSSPQGVSYHTLRHTFASWLVMADENVLTVAKLLGNTVAMVEDTYGHLAPEHRKRAVGRLNGMVTIPPLVDPATEDN